MRKNVAGDKSIQEANDRKMLREIAKKGIVYPKPEEFIKYINKPIKAKDKKHESKFRNMFKHIVGKSEKKGKK